MMKIVHGQGVSIASESFGRRTDPAMLLIMGATASMLGWPDDFRAQLANRGFYVIRFDHRDTGQSTTVPPGEAGYAVEDLADDALRVLDGYGFQQAHIVGMSLGGLLAHMLAVAHPQRVISLTLIASEPLGWDKAALPHISQEFPDHFAALGLLDWSDRRAVADSLVESEMLCAATGAPFDENRERDRIARVLSITDSPASMFNHGTLTMRNDWSGRFRDIRQPVLVIHGTVDPILPIENGQAIADGIRGASLEVLPGVGHALPPDRFAELADRIKAHVIG